MPFSFGFGSLLMLGLPLIGIPILIHLINMMRHRKIEWAAMEFLLDSQKKNSRWIIIKQLLLLLLRMAAVAAIVLMLAQTELKNELGELLGRTTVHHVVLLDDSLSMSEQIGTERAFSRARDAVQRLGEDAAGQSMQQMFTLLPMSRAATEAEPLLREVTVDRDEFKTTLEDTLQGLRATHLRVGPTAALDWIGRLLAEPQSEQRIYYLVSDFRQNEWGQPEQLREQLAGLVDQGSQLRLVDCADAGGPNLAIVDLTAAGGTHAVGVPLEMTLAVRNYGNTPARDVAVRLMVGGREDRVTLEEIPPGETRRRKFEARFFTAGDHEVEAKLDRSDRLEADDARYAVVQTDLALPVLLIDADPAARNARFLSTGLSPGGPVKTGIDPQIQLPDFLERESLDRYRGIYLLNVDHLPGESIARLEDYVRGGGGLGIFLGPMSTIRFLQEGLYQSGEGLMPVPVVGAVDLYLDELQKTPDMQVVDHPMFRIFAGERNSFLQSVAVRRYYEVDPGWSPPDDSQVRVLARLRNRAPLAIEQPFGDGRVIALLTTAAPDWNNWARNPSFPVAIQEMQSYLAAGYRGRPAQQVGTQIAQVLDAARYRDKARVLRPGEDELSTLPVDLPETNGRRQLEWDQTDEPGVYTLKLTTTDGEAELRRFAVNIEPDEGDLAKVNAAGLGERLDGVPFDYHRAGEFSFSAELAGFNLTDILLYALIIVLIAEQVLGYLVSYHPSARAARA